MILTRTPLRVSLFGGGSDIPNYYNEAPGAVLSTSIDKYMYIALCQTAYPGIKLVYNDVEQVTSVNEIKHTRVKQCLKHFGVGSHVEISSFCEIPTKGTGLGSSSTFTVGLINALSELCRTSLNKYDIAELACDIEMRQCREPIGKQDQYAAAFGGVNIIGFSNDSTAVANPGIAAEVINKLDNNLLMFYTGIKRSASDILSVQSKNTNKKAITQKMVDMVFTAQSLLKQGDTDSVGAMLDEGWQLKRQLSYNTSNEVIDHYYKQAMKAGELGGKLLGAGGGGYLLFYVPKADQRNVISALSDLMTFDFNFENSGTTVVYNESKRTF